MSLPAIRALREALPNARIRLAVGEWSREVAADALADEVLVWSAPWVGRPSEGAQTFGELLRRARALDPPPDLAIDLQGDVRAMWLMAATRALRRVGYANTGSAALLTSIVDLDEDANFVEQNYRAVETALGGTVPRRPFTWLDPARRELGRRRLHELLRDAGIEPRGPVVGLHPGAGRRIKEWPVERFAELARRLSKARGATLIATGASGEASKTSVIVRANEATSLDLAGRLTLGELAETMSAMDAFVSCDTAAMHFACALGLPTIGIFGPSDPGRYFSGGPSGFGSSASQIAVFPELWCRPCNLIRRPPRECDEAPSPECLDLVTVDQVERAFDRVLARP